MNWDALGAMGEILGAGAVVASLAYLAVQVKVQNAEARAAAMHNISVGFRDAISGLADEQMATLVSRANAEAEDLSESELIQLYAAIQRIFRVWEEAYLLQRRGRLDEDIWDSMMRQYRVAIGTKAFLRVWENRKNMFNSDFQEFVDDIVPDGGLIYR